MRGRARSAAAVLRTIEQRVVDEIWLSSGLRVLGALLTAALGVTAVTGALSAHDGGYRLALTAHGIGVLAAVSSVAGLVLRRFTWACVATYLCALAAVTTVGAFWWYRTGTHHMPWPTIVAGVLAALLSLGWLRLVLAPIERSQPDMRAHTHAHR